MTIEKTIAKDSIEFINNDIDLKSDSIVVYNTLGFQRSDIVASDIPENGEKFSVFDEEGNRLPIQFVRKHGKHKVLFFTKNLLSMDYKAYALELF